MAELHKTKNMIPKMQYTEAKQPIRWGKDQDSVAGPKVQMLSQDTEQHCKQPWEDTVTVLLLL